MNSNINSVCIQELRALALVISEQNHSVRQTLLLVLQSSAEVFHELYKSCLPQIDWSGLMLSKQEKYEIQLRSAICIFEEAYPEQLRQIQDPPWILFFKGSNLPEASNAIAIVGSRRANYVGLELAEEFAYRLASEGFCVVSGMALGIDASAHKGAIRADRALSTVAVLGSGIDVIYPPAHKELLSEIINSEGTVLSQFEPDSAPYPSNFLNRNRVVAGLSSATIVIQATLKSGSLVTAKHSVEQGKDLYVIPGDIEDRRYEGSNRLIQQGAQLITGIEDLFSNLGIQLQKNADKRQQEKYSAEQSTKKRIIQILADQGNVKVDAMIRQLGKISFEQELLELEISGRIERLPGNVLKLK